MKLTLAEIAQILSCPAPSQGSLELDGVSTDTRTLAAGNLFVALAGPRFDGHNFLPQAAQKGAAAALVSKPPAGLPQTGLPLLHVEDTLLALGALAAAWRGRFDIPLVAVTGSVGKTTTKEMTASILSQIGPCLKTPENYNNEIGVPLTLLSLSDQYKTAVCELAMRGPGQIRYLAEIASPTIGLITNIGVSHLELLSSQSAIAAAKAELLQAMAPNTWALLPVESKYFPDLQKAAAHQQILTFGPHRGRFCAENIRPQPDGLSFFLWLPAHKTGDRGDWHEISLSLPGRHHVANALAAAAAAWCAGASTQQIIYGLEAFMTIDGRTKIHRTPAGFTVIDDTYNANPDSMKAALEVLADTPGHAKIAVLGDMKELGPDAPALHRSLGAEAVRVPHLALLVAVGEHGPEIAAGAGTSLTSAAIQSVPDAQTALNLLHGMVHRNDVVMVKASRAVGLEKVVQGLLQFTAEE